MAAPHLKRHCVASNRLACLPLELRLRGKSTRQSHGTPIFYADITVRSGMSLEEALLAGKELDEIRQTAGFLQSALDAAAQKGFSNGIFEDNEEDGGAVIEEFFTGTDSDSSTGPAGASKGSVPATQLARKLEALASISSKAD